MSLDPDDLDPLARRDPRPPHLKKPQESINADIISLIRQLMIRVERLEEDMRQIKEKLKL